MNKETR